MGREQRQREVRGSSSVHIMQLSGKSFYKEQLQAGEGKAATTSSNQWCQDVQAKTDEVRGGY